LIDEDALIALFLVHDLSITKSLYFLKNWAYGFACIYKLTVCLDFNQLDLQFFFEIYLLILLFYSNIHDLIIKLIILLSNFIYLLISSINFYLIFKIFQNENWNFYYYFFKQFIVFIILNIVSRYLRIYQFFLNFQLQ